MATVSIRYIVNDVDAAIDFYCRHLGFDEEMHPAPAFAMLSRGDLRLTLSAPRGGAARWAGDARRHAAAAGRMEPLRPGGHGPREGGRTSQGAGVRFRNDVVVGVGGKQILVEDPSGNPVELFQPTRDEARLARSATSTS